MLLGFEVVNYLIHMLLHYDFNTLINHPQFNNTQGTLWTLLAIVKCQQGHIKNILLALNIGLKRKTQVQFEIVFFCFECL